MTAHLADTLANAPVASALPSGATFDPVAVLATAPHWLQALVVVAGAVVPVASFAADFLDRYAKLKRARGEAMRLWPFETGWTAITEADLVGVELLAAEVMLGLVPTAPAPGEGKEQAQVRGLAERIARLDEAGKLSQAFAAPKGVSEDQAQAALEEGWLLNV